MNKQKADPVLVAVITSLHYTYGQSLTRSTLCTSDSVRVPTHAVNFPKLKASDCVASDTRRRTGRWQSALGVSVSHCLSCQSDSHLRVGGNFAAPDADYQRQDGQLMVSHMYYRDRACCGVPVMGRNLWASHTTSATIPMYLVTKQLSKQVE